MVSEALREHRVLGKMTFKCVIADCLLRSLKPGEYQIFWNKDYSSNIILKLEKQASETL